MKLELERLHPRRIYANAKWKLEDDKLIQSIIPSENAQESISFTLNPGDNIRLDGEVYHVTSHQRAYEQKGNSRVYHFIYKIKKGCYTPPKWMEIGEVQKERG